jgi:hypothetical protein
MGTLGYKHTNAAKLKIGLGNKGKLISNETKNKLSLASKGRKHSEESKLKISLANTGKPSSCGMLGKHHTPEAKLKISKNLLGENHPNWKGGMSLYPQDWTDILKESIRERDNYICQECGIHQDELDQKLDIHHIDYNKDNLNPTNLISLCRSCHIKTNYNRIQWYEYFSISISHIFSSFY